MGLTSSVLIVILFAVEEKMDLLMDRLKDLPTGQKNAGQQVEKQLLILLLLFLVFVFWNLFEKKLA